MKNVIKYIYGLYDYEGELFYIGQTDNPKSRLSRHRMKYTELSYLEILDYYVDVEQLWIRTKLEEGVKLTNKVVLNTDHLPVTVGDRFYYQEGTRVQDKGSFFPSDISIWEMKRRVLKEKWIYRRNLLERLEVEQNRLEKEKRIKNSTYMNDYLKKNRDKYKERYGDRYRQGNLTREQILENRKWWFKIVDLEGNDIERDLLRKEMKEKIKGSWSDTPKGVYKYKGQECKVVGYLNPTKSQEQ